MGLQDNRSVVEHYVTDAERNIRAALRALDGEDWRTRDLWKALDLLAGVIQ